MALVLADRVNETTTTAGTGTLTLAGAVSGYQSFSVIGNANTTYYTIVHQTANEWEVGIGTYTSAGTTLSRDTVLASSAGGTTKVTFSAGTKFVFCDYPAGRAVYLDTASNATIPGITLSGGTANGVAYLNGSKVLTTGSALQFSGTYLQTLNGTGIQMQNAGATANWFFETSGLNLSFTSAQNGAAIWSINGSEQMRLTSTGLGIGTSSPGAKLDVQGTGSGVASIKSTSSAYSLKLLGSTTVNPVFLGASGDTFVTYVGGADRMTIGSSGNVTINAASSAETLTVKGLNTASTSRGNLYVYTTDPATADYGGQLSLGGVYSGSLEAPFASIAGRWSSGTTGYMQFITLNAGTLAEGMRLNSTGLGIGTSSPARKLDVNGTIRIADGQSVEWGGTSLYIAGTSNTLLFGTSSSERMRLDSSGKLGIGTSSPTSTVDVFGLQANTGASSAGSPTGTMRLAYAGAPAATNYGASLVFSQYWWSSSTTQVAVGQITGVKTAGDGNFGGGLAFFYGPSGANALAEGMRITDAGYVGIGTTSPSNPLTVSSDISAQVRINAISANVNARLTLNASGTGLNVLGTTGAVPLAFLSGSTEYMRLDTSGNLGLGVAPSAWATYPALQVSKGSLWGPGSSFYLSANLYYDGTNRRYINSAYASEYEQASGQHIWLTAASGTAGAIVSLTQSMTLDASGNLGIGTTSPGNKLTVNGVASAVGMIQVTGTPGASQGVLKAQAGSGATLGYNRSRVDLLSQAGTAGWSIYNYGDGGDLFAIAVYGGSDALDITQAGNVGIGTSSPSYKLDVNGAINTSADLISQGSNARISLYRSTGINYFDWASGQSLYFSTQTSAGGAGRNTLMVLDTSGNLLVGTTSSYGGPGRINVGFNQSTNFGITLRNTSATATGVFVSFENSGGTGNGSISQTNSTTVAYNTSSDRRLKKDIAPAPQAGVDIDAIEIVSHGWVSNDDTVKYGVVAQDLQSIVPQAVTAGDDGDEIERVWGVDYSKLVPMLIKEIQSLRQRVAQLEVK